MGDNQGNSGRVTTQQFYEALLNQNKEAEAREQRVMEKIDSLTAIVSGVAKQPEICQGHFDTIRSRITKNENDIKTSRIWERLLALFTALAAALGIGIKQ